jgi:tape measure domain-containing protein
MEKQLELALKIKVDPGSGKAAIDGLSSSFDKLGQAGKGAGEGLSQATEEINVLTQPAGKTAIDGLSAGVNKLGAAGKSAGDGLSQAAEEIHVLTQPAGKMAIDGLSASIHKLGGSAQSAGAGAQTLTQAEQELAQMLRHAQGQGAALAGMMQGLGTRQSAAAGGARALSQAEQALAQVLRDIETPQERFQAQIAQVNALFQAGALTIGQYHRAVDAYQAQLTKGDRTTTLFTRSTGLLTGALAGLSAVALARGYTETATSQDRLNRLMEAGTDTARQAAEAYAYGRGVARAYGLELVATETAWGKLNATAQGTALAGAPIQTIFAGISHESARLSQSQAELEGELTAIVQMMGKGKVTAEEWNGQLAERLPTATAAAARALNVTREEFYQLMQEGKLLPEDFLPKLARELLKTEAHFDGATANVHRMANAWTELKQSLTSSEWVSQIAAGVAERLDLVSAAIERARKVSARNDFLPSGMFGGGLSEDVQAKAYEADLKRRMERLFPPQSAPGATQSPVSDLIKAAAQKYGVPYELARAVAQTESGLSQYNKAGGVLASSAGALGVMQLIPATAKAYSVDPAQVDQNVEGGVHYLADLLKKYGDITKAVAAYNLGETKFDQRGLSNLPKETEQYIEKIKKAIGEAEIGKNFVNLSDYKANLKDAEALFKANLDRQVAETENAGKKLSAIQATQLAGLEAWKARGDTDRAQALIGKTGEERRRQERENLAAEAADLEEFARRRAEIEKAGLADQETALRARLSAYQAEKARAGEFEASTLDRLKLDEQIKGAETELAVLAEKRRQIEIKAGADIAAARQKEAEALDQARLAALQTNQEAIQRAQDLASQRAQNLQAQVQAGMLTEGQMRKELSRIYDESARAIDGNARALEKLAQSSRDPDIVLAAERAKGAWLEMVTAVRTPMQALLQQWRDTTSQMEQATVGWTEGFADALADMVMTGKADFRGLLDSIERDLARMMSQRATAALIAMIGGSAGAGSGFSAQQLGTLISGAWGSLASLFSGGSSALGRSLPGESYAQFGQRQGGYGALVGLAGSLLGQLVKPYSGQGALRNETGEAVQSAVLKVMDLLGYIWPVLKAVRPLHNLQMNLAQSMYPDRRGNLAAGIFAGPLAAFMLGDVVKSGAGYGYSARTGLRLTESYDQNGAPIEVLKGMGGALGKTLDGFTRRLGITLDDFTASFENRGTRMSITGYGKDGQPFYRSDSFKITDINVQGQLELFELAILKRQSTLKQFDDFLLKSAVRASESLTDLNQKYRQVMKVRAFEGERSGMAGEIDKLWNRYNKAVDIVQEIAPGGKKRRAELDKLDLSLNRQFGVFVDQFQSNLDQFRGGSDFGIAKALRDIADQARDLTAANKELEVAAKRSKGKIQYTPVSAAAIEDARQMAVDKLQRDVIAQMRGLTGAAEPLYMKMSSLRQQFAQVRAHAGELGLSLQQVAEFEAQAVETLRTSLTKPILESMAAQAQAVIDQFRGPQSTVKRLTGEINAGMAGLGGLDPQAGYESAVKIMGLVEQRFQVELQNYQALLTAAQAIKGVVDGLKLSNLSPLNPEGRLKEAQGQYNTALLKAQAGDATALANLGGLAQSYLTEARSYYASSDQYVKIFQGVTASLDKIYGDTMNDPESGLRAIQKRTADLMNKLQAYLDRQDAAQQQRDQALQAAVAANATAIASAVAQGSRDIVLGVGKVERAIKNHLK